MALSLLPKAGLSQRMMRKGLGSLVKVTCPLGQGGGGALFWSILAGPCSNFKDAIDLQERSKLPERQTSLPSFRGRYRNAKALKRLHGGERMQYKSQTMKMGSDASTLLPGRVPRSLYLYPCLTTAAGLDGV